MSNIKQFLYQHAGCPLPPCTDGTFEIQEGNDIRITLEERFPEWPDFIVGTIVKVVPTVNGRDYTIQFDFNDLNGGPMFKGCDIQNIDPYCCCDENAFDIANNAKSIENNIGDIANNAESIANNAKSIANNANLINELSLIVDPNGDGDIDADDIDGLTTLITNLVDAAGGLNSTQVQALINSAIAGINMDTGVTVNEVNAAIEDAINDAVSDGTITDLTEAEVQTLIDNSTIETAQFANFCNEVTNCISNNANTRVAISNIISGAIPNVFPDVRLRDEVVLLSNEDDTLEAPLGVWGQETSITFPLLDIPSSEYNVVTIRISAFNFSDGNSNSSLALNDIRGNILFTQHFSNDDDDHSSFAEVDVPISQDALILIAQGALLNPNDDASLRISVIGYKHVIFQ